MLALSMSRKRESRLSETGTRVLPPVKRPGSCIMRDGRGGCSGVDRVEEPGGSGREMRCTGKAEVKGLRGTSQSRRSPRNVGSERLDRRRSLI